MSTSELKSQIISKINTIEDEAILVEIYKLVDLESEMDADYRLTVEERNAIDIGLKDIQRNKVYSSETADNMIREWLKK